MWQSKVGLSACHEYDLFKFDRTGKNISALTHGDLWARKSDHMPLEGFIYGHRIWSRYCLTTLLLSTQSRNVT